MTFRTDEEVTRLLERLQNDPEVDLTHPFTVLHRVPVIDSFYPRWAYVAALAMPEGTNLWRLKEPNEQDAALVALYIQYMLERWYYQNYIESLKKLPIDIDPGTNTITFAKTGRGWVYRRATWKNQLCWPIFDNEIQYSSLLDLVDKIETHSDLNGGYTMNEKWVTFKETHDIK